jgi:hypothetical protein
MIVDVDKDREARFRQTVARVKGLHKGVIKESFEEAIDLWIAEQKKLKKELREIDKKTSPDR